MRGSVGGNSVWGAEGVVTLVVEMRRRVPGLTQVSGATLYARQRFVFLQQKNPSTPRTTPFLQTTPVYIKATQNTNGKDRQPAGEKAKQTKGGWSDAEIFMQWIREKYRRPSSHAPPEMRAQIDLGS